MKNAPILHRNTPNADDPAAISTTDLVDKEERYKELCQRIEILVDGENDAISIMATIATELYHGLPYADWVGFYRVVDDKTLKVGPYQGGHGCLVIDFDRGICGACATTETAQLVDDVSMLPHHIACSQNTQSELVLPVYNRHQKLIAVLDLDSDALAAFDDIDILALTELLEQTFAKSCD